MGSLYVFNLEQAKYSHWGTYRKDAHQLFFLMECGIMAREENEWLMDLAICQNLTCRWVGPFLVEC